MQGLHQLHVISSTLHGHHSWRKLMSSTFKAADPSFAAAGVLGIGFDMGCLVASSQISLFQANFNVVTLDDRSSTVAAKRRNFTV